MSYLEISLGEKKAELESERSQNIAKVIEMQTELQQLRSTSKINEERAKLIEADK